MTGESGILLVTDNGSIANIQDLAKLQRMYYYYTAYIIAKELMCKLCYILQITRTVKKPKVNEVVGEIQQEIKPSKSEKPKLFEVFKLSAAYFNKQVECIFQFFSVSQQCYMVHFLLLAF